MLIRASLTCLAEETDGIIQVVSDTWKERETRILGLKAAFE